MASDILGHINCPTGKVRKAVLFGKLAKRRVQAIVKPMDFELKEKSTNMVRF